MSADKIPMPADPNQGAIDLLEEIAGDETYTFSIKKKSDQTDTLAYLRDVPSSEFSIDWLAQEFGGGEYSIQLKQKGRFLPGKTCKVVIHDSVKGRLQKRQQQEKEERDERRAVGGDSGRMIELLESLIEKQSSRPDPTATMLKTMSENSSLMMQQQQAAQAAQMQMMMAMIENSTKLQIAMMGAGSKNDMAAMISAMAPIMQTGMKTANAPAGNSLRESIEMIATIRELFGKEEKESSTFDKIADLLGDGVSAYLAAKGINPATAMNALPQGMPEQPSGDDPEQQPNPQTQQEFVSKILAKLKSDNLKHLPRLIKAADKGRNPQDIAEMIVDTLADPEAAVLASALAHPQWAEALFDNSPEVAKRLTWFQQLRQAIRTELSGGEVAEEPAHQHADGVPRPVNPPETTTLDDDPETQGQPG